MRALLYFLESCPGLEVTKHGKEWGRQIHRDKESLIIRRALPTAHTLLSSANPRVNALSFDSSCLLPESPRLEKGRKSRAVMPVHTCTRGICRRDSQGYKEAQSRDGEREKRRRGASKFVDRNGFGVMGRRIKL